MIVVEGPDGAGKTTLCEYICRQFNLEMGERATANRDEIYKTTRQDTWKAVYEEYMATSSPRVWDRIGPYSDPIYSLRGIPTPRNPAFTAGEVKQFHRWLLDPHFGCLILCLPPLETLLKNVRGSHQLEGVTEQTRRIRWDYKKMHASGDGLVYDYTNTRGTGTTQVAMLVSQHLRLRKGREQLATHT